MKRNELFGDPGACFMIGFLFGLTAALFVMAAALSGDEIQYGIAALFAIAAAIWCVRGLRARRARR